MKNTKKRRIRIFALALLLTGLTASAVEAKVSVIGGLTHEKTAQPGETYDGAIVLKNDSPQPQEVKIYQTDYLFYCDGTNHYSAPGTVKRSNADWLSYGRKKLIIPPASTETVNYTVRVPAEPNRVGTYWSLMMVEEVPTSSPESTEAEDVQMQVGITQIVRYGIQMMTHIGNTGEKSLDFVETKLLKEDPRRFLQVDIANTGQRWLRPALWAELYDDAGRYVGRFESERRRLYPGTSVRCKVDLTDVPEGTYQALIVADCRGDDVFGVEHTLKF